MEKEYKEITSNEYFNQLLKRPDSFSNEEYIFFSSFNIIGPIHELMICLFLPNKSRIRLHIGKCEDEWFYVHKPITSKTNGKYFLCDQFEGVKSLINDLNI